MPSGRFWRMILPGLCRGSSRASVSGATHRVREEDIPELLKIGKKHLFTLELTENEMHEDAAALRISAALCGQNLRWSEPCEGKSNMICTTDGMLQIDVEGLLRDQSVSAR